jgi:hypothetical protein
MYKEFWTDLSEFKPTKKLMEKKSKSVSRAGKLEQKGLT